MTIFTLVQQTSLEWTYYYSVNVSEGKLGYNLKYSIHLEFNIKMHCKVNCA